MREICLSCMTGWILSPLCDGLLNDFHNSTCNEVVKLVYFFNQVRLVSILEEYILTRQQKEEEKRRQRVGISCWIIRWPCLMPLRFQLNIQLLLPSCRIRKSYKIYYSQKKNWSMDPNLAQKGSTVSIEKLLGVTQMETEMELWHPHLEEFLLAVPHLSSLHHVLVLFGRIITSRKRDDCLLHL